MKNPAILLASLAAAGTLTAGQVSSSSFQGNTADLPGGRAANTGGTIVANLSTGAPALGSTATAGQIMLRHNYVGSLFDIREVDTTTASVSLPENSSLQITATAIMDDTTLLQPVGSIVAWAEVSPDHDATIDNLGLLNVGVVYQDSPQQITATIGGVTDLTPLTLTVIDTDPDNFAEYASDGIHDSWQVQFFGLPPNPMAAPHLDPDKDGSSTGEEFLFGFSPVDGRDRILLFIRPVPDTDPVQFVLVLNKVIPDRIYQIQSTAIPSGFNFVNLGDPFLSTTLENDAEAGPIIPPASIELLFFRVKVLLP
ncbi:MAG: hypothetical protein AAGJ79_11835 [Verrucomicrobiota bacterium]